LEKEFAASGTKIQWQYFRAAGPAVSEALASHQVDFVFHGDLPSVVVRSTGIKTRYLLPLYARSNIYVAVPVKSQIQKLADLKGKVTSSFRGTATQLVAARVLSSVGLQRTRPALHHQSRHRRRQCGAGDGAVWMRPL